MNLYRKLWIKHQKRRGREVWFNTERNRWEATVVIQTAFGRSTVLEGVTGEALEASMRATVRRVRERSRL
jgi:hypothetical protein